MNKGYRLSLGVTLFAWLSSEVFPVLLPLVETTGGYGDMSLVHRERRWWTASEDKILQDAAGAQEEKYGNIKDWNRVCANLPGRTNKDCRKRWDKVRCDIRKGPWTLEEDCALRTAITMLGTRWSLVAMRLQSRNADQCSKRWRQVLNPNIKRTPWIEEEDEALRSAILRYGNDWNRVRAIEFPERSTHDVRNRSVALERHVSREVDGHHPMAFEHDVPDRLSESASCSLDDMREESELHRDQGSSVDRGSDSSTDRAENHSPDALLSNASGENPFDLQINQLDPGRTVPDDFASPLFGTSSWDIDTSSQLERQLDASPTVHTSVLDLGIEDCPVLENEFDMSLDSTATATPNTPFPTSGVEGLHPAQGTFICQFLSSQPSVTEECHKSRKRSITIVLRREDAAIMQELLDRLLSVDAELTITFV